MVKRYYVDASGLTPQEYNEFYVKIDGFSFMTSIDIKHIRCFEVYWDLHEELQNVIDIPENCYVHKIS